MVSPALAAGDNPPADATAATAGSPPAAAVAGDGFIEVWRPGGRSDGRSHKTRRPLRRGASQPAALPELQSSEGAPVAVPADPASEQSTAENARPKRDSPRHQRFDRSKQNRPDKSGDGRERHGRPAARRGERPRKDRGERPDREERERYYVRSGKDDRADKTPDPNSPFAKLAALKQQLETSTKDRS
jgi:ATP-dependent RNA helicase SUPV3L1/SUV3